MIEEIHASWWVLVLRGVCAILFGILAFLWPGITIASLVLLFGAYALVNGVLALVMAFRSPKGAPGKATTVLLGLLSVGVAVLAILYPGLTTLSLLWMIAGWAIVTGAFEIAAAIRLRHLMSGSWVLVLSGVLSVIFGALLFAMPLAGALSVVWLIGSYAIVFGVMLIASAVKLRKLVHLTPAAAGVV